MKTTKDSPKTLIIYKLFIRPYLGCGDIIHYLAFNAFFNENFEGSQYNAALVIASYMLKM